SAGRAPGGPRCDGGPHARSAAGGPPPLPGNGRNPSRRSVDRLEQDKGRHRGYPDRHTLGRCRRAGSGSGRGCASRVLTRRAMPLGSGWARRALSATTWLMLAATGCATASPVAQTSSVGAVDAPRERVLTASIETEPAFIAGIAPSAGLLA